MKVYLLFAPQRVLLLNSEGNTKASPRPSALHAFVFARMPAHACLAALRG